jgi:hypothetical protein
VQNADADDRDRQGDSEGNRRLYEEGLGGPGPQWRAHAPYPPPGACPEPEHAYSLPGELISSDGQWRDVQLFVHEGAYTVQVEQAELVSAPGLRSGRRGEDVPVIIVSSPLALNPSTWSGTYEIFPGIRCTSPAHDRARSTR